MNTLDLERLANQIEAFDLLGTYHDASGLPSPSTFSKEEKDAIVEGLRLLAVSKMGGRND